MTKSFKHQAYLNKYKNCPENCEEKDLTAFRWVHNPPTSDDFCPVLIKSPGDHRALDNTDIVCLGYGLSLFIDVKSSIVKYLYWFNKQDREKKRENYKKNRGTCTAKITITKNDGVSDTPNKDGHFNFFEYEGSNLFGAICEILDNFTYNGKS